MAEKAQHIAHEQTFDNALFAVYNFMIITIIFIGLITGKIKSQLRINSKITRIIMFFVYLCIIDITACYSAITRYYNDAGCSAFLFTFFVLINVFLFTLIMKNDRKSIILMMDITSIINTFTCFSRLCYHVVYFLLYNFCEVRDENTEMKMKQQREYCFYDEYNMLQKYKCETLLLLVYVYMVRKIFAHVHDVYKRQYILDDDMGEMIPLVGVNDGFIDKEIVVKILFFTTVSLKNLYVI